jgi:hypothetical protein
MSSIRSLDILDIARSFGQKPFDATPHTISSWLENNYLARRGGVFNYDPSIQTTYDAFRGLHSIESAVRYCSENGNPKGRKQNASAIKSIMPYVLKHPSVCHRIGLTAVAIGRFDGRTVYARIKAPLLRVESDKAFVVMPGFRMSHRPKEIEIDFACSVALATFAQGDYNVADFEYLYAGPGEFGGERVFEAIHGHDRFRFDEGTINRLLDVFVKGVALAHEQGLNREEPHLRGYRIIDPREPRFF